MVRLWGYARFNHFRRISTPTARRPYQLAAVASVVIADNLSRRSGRWPGKSSMSANFALLNKVRDVISNGSVRRDQVLRHVTDLFIVSSVQCTDEDVALFDDVFTRLVVEIEISARALLAVRLAPIKNAPSNVICMLAFDDEIDVAAPVLENSERLDEVSLVRNAKEKSQGHLLAISRRQSLSPAVTDVLVVRGDQQVVQSTVENRGARFSDAGFATLVLRSDGDDRLAERVGSRPELPPDLFLKLLAKASESVRTKLENAHPHARHEVRQVVAEVAGRIRAEVLDHSPDDVERASIVEQLHQSGQLNDHRLGSIASVGRFEEVSAALALMSELPLRFIERAMMQEGAETIVIIGRALELSWSTVKAILMVRDRNHQIPLRDIARCRASFQQLIPGTAREIVHYYRIRGHTDRNQHN